jgi:hypothetical protein
MVFVKFLVGIALSIFAFWMWQEKLRYIKDPWIGLAVFSFIIGICVVAWQLLGYF